ncbi:MAG: hypothetical protein JWR80_3621 [Bradyrhizobium sp.]|jgi:hypothetical protein|nr:hypothetical protein [Bradyrhizobium sp.]
MAHLCEREPHWLPLWPRPLSASPHFRFWHFSDMPTRADDVCSWGQTRRLRRPFLGARRRGRWSVVRAWYQTGMTPKSAASILLLIRRRSMEMDGFGWDGCSRLQQGKRSLVPGHRGRATPGGLGKVTHAMRERPGGARNALAGVLAGPCPDGRPMLHRVGQASGAAKDYVE